MLRFGKSDTFDVLRLILSTTLDERIMLQTWRLFRKTTKAPLFAVDGFMSPEKRGSLNRIIIEEIDDAGASVADMIRLTGLHRGTVYKYLTAYRELAPTARQRRVSMRRKLLDRAEEFRLDLMLERQKAFMEDQKKRLPPA